MKEILFELNDGQVVGLSMIGLVAVWLFLTSFLTAGGVYSLARSGEMDDDMIGNFLVVALVSAFGAAILIVIVAYWQITFWVILATSLFVVPSLLAYWLGNR